MKIIFISYDNTVEMTYKNSLKDAQMELLETRSDIVIGTNDIDAVVVDYSTQKSEDALSDICSFILQIRKKQRIPIFTLLKTTRSIDRQVFLQLGATGVFDQTIEPNEFTLTISNILTIKNLDKDIDIEQTTKTKLLLVPENLTVTIEDKEFQLTKLEYKLLDYLEHKNGNTAGYDELINLLWGMNQKNGHTRVANIVFRIRKKIEKDPMTPKYVKTVHGKGYRLNENEN